MAYSRAAFPQKSVKYFLTVNHAKVIWDPKKKLKGITGRHLNIWSLMPKRDEIQHLLVDSNFLALTETWLPSHTPKTVIDVPCNTCFRKVLVYIKDIYKWTKVNLDTYGLECLTLNEVLSPKMNFNIITLYNPPKHNVIFCQIFDDLLKVLNHRSETILQRDFNKTGWTKTESKHLKELYPSINCTRKSKSQPESPRQAKHL